MVSQADALVDVVTMMVKLEHASVAHFAVRRVRRTVEFARFAITCFVNFAVTELFIDLIGINQ